VLRRQFNVPLEGGVRIKPSTTIETNVLNVSRIENLFGGEIASELIRGTER